MDLINGECRCPRGTRFLSGRCRVPTNEPEKTCGADEIGTYPNCRCARGFTGAPPNCRPIACPANQELIDGACRCRYPLKWNGKRCVADTPKACPADSVGNYPNCRCKRGTTGTPGNCKRIVDEPRKCPRRRFRWHASRTASALVMSRASVPGLPRHAAQLQAHRHRAAQCPEGFRGTPPNCKRIVIEPRRCPQGFRGMPPNCKRIVLEPRRLCPPGFRGSTAELQAGRQQNPL